MSQHTPTHVESYAAACYEDGYYVAADMLRAYAATLRQATRVDEEACRRAFREEDGYGESRMGTRDYQVFRDGFFAGTCKDGLQVAHVGTILEVAAILKSAEPWRCGKTIEELGDLLEAALSAQPAERQGEAVAWTLKWPEDKTVNVLTTFPSRKSAEAYAEGCKGSPEIVPLYLHAERARVPEGMVPADALRDLYSAYVRTLEAGMDRITSLGGDCDSVEHMERTDPALIVARRTLALAAAPSQPKDAGEVGMAEQSCDYQGYEFGAGSYPDSYCLDGVLHDADSTFLSDEDRPCPMCRPLDAIDWWTEQNAMFVEGDESEEETQARARANAVSLVTDIRRNRGVETDLEALATTQPEDAE